MQTITVTAPVHIEVLAPTTPAADGIKLRETDDGAQLVVPTKTVELLTQFGWLPPVYDAEDAD